MGTVFEIEATITERGQTTVPSAIRRMLGVAKRGSVIFRGMDDGTVIIAAKPEGDAVEDPAFRSFLAFLERDMSRRPETLVPATRSLLDRTDALIGDVKVDLGQPLDDV